MVEDSTVPPEEIKRIGQRVLVIERVILRRPWGMLFAITAVAIFMWDLFPLVIYISGFSTDYRPSVALVVNTKVELSGAIAAIWIFRRVYALGLVRQAAEVCGRHCRRSRVRYSLPKSW